MRFAWLYLRSRLVDRAAVVLLVVMTAAWTWERWLRGDGLALLLAQIFTPVAGAAIISVTMRTPFGDLERASSRRLVRWRLSQLLGLLALGAGCLLIAAWSWQNGDLRWMLCRNLFAFTGAGVLIGRVITSGLAWIAPVVLGIAAFVSASDTSIDTGWLLLLRPSDDLAAGLLTVALVGAGLAVAALPGAPETVDDAVW